MSNPISRRLFLKSTGAAAMGSLLAACSEGSSSAVVSPADGSISLTLSWWGDDSRHAAYQEALAAFSRAYSNLSVTPFSGTWEDWAGTMSAKLSSGTAEDVCQIPWNWLPQYAGTQTFLDLQTVSDYLDLSQWDQQALFACRTAEGLLAVPMATTGRIFYWNLNLLHQAGITQIPLTLEDLYAAGEAFQTQLGEDFYPLYLDGYGRMALMVFYLESVYGQPWADPETFTLNYSLQQVIEGLDFIKDLVDHHVLMSMPVYYGTNGDVPVDQSIQWTTGKLGGVFEWDTDAARYRATLDEDSRDSFTVGEEIQMGEYKGGFTRVSMAMAIPHSCQHPAEAAMLVDFLLNQEAGAAILGSACGIPASRSGLAAAQAAGTLDPLMEQAHSKVLASCLFSSDPLFEDDSLASSGGIYQQVFETIDYDGLSGAAVAKDLSAGMQAAGYTTSF